MKLIKYMLGVFSIAIFVCNSYAQTPRTTELQITWPVNRSVFQRPSSGQAIVSLSAQTTYFADNKLQFRIRRLNPQNEDRQEYIYGNSIIWLDYDDAGAGGEITSYINGQYKAVKRNVTLSEGWYLLETKTKKTGSFGFLGNMEKTSVIFGVGDVYLIAGQSNASGFKSNDGDPNLVNIFENLGTMPKAVSVINRNSESTENDGSKAKLIPFRNGFNPLTKESVIFPKGVSSWLWAPLAYKMLNSSGAPNVPVMFFNVANPDQSIQAWNTGSQNYQRLRHLSQTFCNIYGTRSILWMQGERDVKEHYEYNNSTWPGDERSTVPLSDNSNLATDYSKKLEAIINQYNSDLGSNNAAQWSIAKVSRSNYRQSGFSEQCDIYRPTPNMNFGNIRGEQQEATNITNSRNGADIDNVGVTDRGSCQEIHLSNQGLDKAADEWFGNQPWTSAPNTSKTILKMTVTPSGGNYVLTVPTSQNNLNLVTFRWVRSNFNDAGGIYNGQLATNIISGNVNSNSITVSPNSADLEYYVCYASPNNDADGEANGLNSNWYVSQPFLTKTTIPTQFISPSSPIGLGQPINSENSFQITASNLEWEATESTNWFEIITEDDLNGGGGVSNFKVRATETNNTTSNRSADITFLLSDGTNKYVTISQSATTGCQDTPLTNLSPTNPNGEWQGFGTMKINQSIDGNQIKVGGVSPEVSGIGTHAYSRLVYNISGYNTFTGKVGLDDEVDGGCGGTQRVRFVIKGNNSQLWESGEVSPTDGPISFTVPINGITTLELIVEPLDNNYCDHTDWLDPKLLCAASSCTIPANPTNAYASSPTISSGQSTPLNVTCSSVGSTGIWSNGASGNTINVSPTTTTTYTVRCKNGNCLSAGQESVLVTVGTNPPPSGLTAGTCYTISSVANLSNNMQAMTDGSIQRQGATGAANQIWRAETGAAANQLKFVSAATNQYITVNTPNYADHMYLASNNNNYQSWNIETSGGYYRLSIPSYNTTWDMEGAGGGQYLQNYGNTSEGISNYRLWHFQATTCPNTNTSGLTNNSCYIIRSVQTNNPLQAMNDGKVQQQSVNGQNNQIWKAEASGSQYMFKGMSNNQYIRVNDSNNGTKMDVGAAMAFDMQANGANFRISKNATTWDMEGAGSGVALQNWGTTSEPFHNYRLWSFQNVSCPTTSSNCTNRNLTAGEAVYASTGYGTVNTNLNQAGTQIKIGGDTQNSNPTTFDYGIGTHAASEIIYELGGHSFTKFKADVGRDWNVYSCNTCGTGQTIVFKVINDSNGQLLAGPITKTIWQTASPIEATITGISRIKLVVEDGGDQPWGDWANWANARLECPSANVRELTVTPEEWFWVSRPTPMMENL